MKISNTVFSVLFRLLFMFNAEIIQSQVFYGVIYNSTMKPVEGAYVYHSKSGQHVHSDKNGAFSISEIHSGDSMVISHVGYLTQKMQVTDIHKSLKIIMEEKLVTLSEITISPTINALTIFSDIDIETSPVNSSQEILRKIPGVVIGQHAGGGKAEQIFIRGFDADHGTDIHMTSDGIPVNMVSHAHGQGYADLHFIIPETVETIGFGKGPYDADKGNFATGGHVAFKSKERLDNSELKLEGGQFNSGRLAGLFSVLDEDNHSAYVATEYLFSDGPFESPQHFKRTNLMAKYTGKTQHGDKITLLASYFSSSWNASGQIPQRAVDQGMISRFGAIDDTEGGETSRTNLLAEFRHFMDDKHVVTSRVYYAGYDFDLISNFTFFLNDSIYGDQINQRENRNIFGMESMWESNFYTKKTQWKITSGISLRNDQSKNNGLYHTVNRQNILEKISFGNINETNLGGYLNSAIHVGKMVINPALRVDYFMFQYYNKLSENYDLTYANRTVLSPKLNLLYTITDALQLYLKSGKGFHSNDTRVVLSQTGKDILPSAYGSDLGFIWRAGDRLILNSAWWYLFLKQEFIYVGDEGVVEPGGKTRRAGFDGGIRYQFTKSLFLNVDLNVSNGRALEETKGNDYIPLAPSFVSTGGLSYMNHTGFYGNVNYRYVGDRPANEDYSIIAEGYFIIDANAGYQWKNIGIGFKVENLLNGEWKETQFATETRLKNEVRSVEEIHFIPGAPFFLKGILSFRF